MEYLASDIKNITKSLGRMQKYILGKTIERNKTNNIKYLKMEVYFFPSWSLLRQPLCWWSEYFVKEQSQIKI